MKRGMYRSCNRASRDDLARWSRDLSLFLRDPSRGWQGASVLVVLYAVLGYVAYFAAVGGYALDVEDPRPHLSVGKGVPAWGFFLVGGVLLILVAVAWALWVSPRNALLFGGIAIAYLGVSYPQKLSIRRAALSGFGLVIASVGVVFF